MREFRDVLIAAFLKAQAATGNPVHPLPDVRREVFTDSNGKTYLLKTSKEGWLQTHAKTMGIDADMKWLDGTIDFVAFAYFTPKNRRVAQVFAIPAQVANDALKDGNVAWLATPPSSRGRGHNTPSRLRRFISFYSDKNGTRSWYGYDTKWARYKVGEVDVNTLPATGPTPAPAPRPRPAPSVSVAALMAECIEKLARATGLPEDEIHITLGRR